MSTRQVTTLSVIEKTVGDGNWDSSRAPIDRVVIHTMVGTAQNADNRFNSQDRVSAHYGVLLDGTIWHWVDEDKTAYHAGDYSMNQRSIGIEHEDNGDFNGLRSDSLYNSSAKLVRDICNFYGIPIDREHIIKHSEVIATGCPDALDIDRIVRQAGEAMVTLPQTEVDGIRQRRDDEWNVLTAIGRTLNVEVVEDLTQTQDNIISAITKLQVPPVPETPAVDNLVETGNPEQPFVRADENGNPIQEPVAPEVPVQEPQPVPQSFLGSVLQWLKTHLSN